MKHATAVLSRLVVERSEAAPLSYTGFLHMRDTNKKIMIGSAGSREFRLLQCLFSPKNFLYAKYEPVVQTHERVFGAIGMSTDALNPRLTSRETAEDEVALIVERSMRSLQKGEVGEYFAFISKDGKIQMMPRS